MRIRFLRPLVVATLPLLFSAHVYATPTTTTPITASPSTAASATYTLDPNHTYVLWHVNHFGFSNPSGKWMANGTLEFDKAQPQKSSVTATINVADVVTGIPALDKHLQTDTFFDVAQFPTATFTSNNVKVTGKDTADVSGNLTVHGVTKPITLHITMNKMGMSLMTNRETIGFTGSAVLNRSDYGVSAYAPGLGDKVTLEIEAEASQSAS